MKKKIRVAILGLALTSSLAVMTGCGTAKKFVNESRTTVNNAKNAESTATTAATEVDKYNQYMGILNIMSANGGLTTFETDYAEKMSDENGNFVKDENYHPREITTTKQALDAAKNAPDVKPKMAVDADAKKLISSLEKEYKLLEQIYSYYSEKDYVNDDYKKGEELHTELMAAIKESTTPAEAFTVGMEDIIAAQTKKEREESEKNGEKVTIVMLDSVDAADALLEEVNVYSEALNKFNKETDWENLTEEAVDALQLPAANVEKLVILNAALDETIKKLEGFGDKELEKEGYNNAVFFSTYIRAVKELKTSTNELIDATKNGTLDVDSAYPEDFYDDYDKLINEYNRTIK